jgi:hypothetical protein
LSLCRLLHALQLLCLSLVPLRLEGLVVHCSWVQLLLVRLVLHWMYGGLIDMASSHILLLVLRRCMMLYVAVPPLLPLPTWHPLLLLYLPLWMLLLLLLGWLLTMVTLLPSSRRS